MATSKGSKGKERPPADKFNVSIIIEERKDAQPLVRKRGLDLVQTEILDEGKRFRLTFFLTEVEIKELRKSGFSLEVGENVSELGLQRQTEVAKGDRFDGGRVAPKGLGVVRAPELEGPK
jgi:hypothetical protein